MPTSELKKANPTKQRGPIGLDRELEKNLRAYETGAHTIKAIHPLTASAPIVAVSLCAFALPQMTLAEVVCTPVNESVHGSPGHNGNLKFDLNNDGINDVSVNAYSTFILGSAGNFFREDVLTAGGLEAGNAIAAKQGSAFAGRSGQKLGPSVPFFKNALMASSVANQSSHRSKGNWLDVKSPRYLGVKFLISGETHFGWIRFTSASSDQGTITGYAYETVANKPIIAGACKEGAADGESLMEPGPGSLGRLAAGAAGK